MRFVIVLVFVFAVLWHSQWAGAWGTSTHAYIAARALSSETAGDSDAYVKLGSQVPDFFWYLDDIGLIGSGTAHQYHGVTEDPQVLDSTVAFYLYFLDTFSSQHERLRLMAEGIRAHVVSDVEAHNFLDGYVEGKGMWIDALAARTGIKDRPAMHLAIEFAMDSLLVGEYGSQLQELDASEGRSYLPLIDEFEDYIEIQKALERITGFYGGYLMKAVGDPSFASDQPGELLPESANQYLRALRILLGYPRELYETLTTSGMHWERNALPEVIRIVSM